MKHFLLLSLCLLFSSCQNKSNQSPHQIKVAISDEPQTLDPRQARNLPTINILQSLYEGLMRQGADGQLIPAAAESFEISPDQLTYTFHLRNAKWSDGTPVTAADFEKTWKSSLDPKNLSPNAYQLDPIKGAEAARNGKTAISDVGVTAKDDLTLIVKLEKPTPYFLNLTTTFFYFPIHTPNESSFVGNGPFTLKHWKHHNEVSLSKNPNYWDQERVNLNELTYVIADDHTALQLFEGGELDWAGSPASTLPTDALKNLKKENRLSVTPGAGTHWVRLNVTDPSLHKPEFRRQLRDALNRKNLVEHVLQGNQAPAYSIVPPAFDHYKPLFTEKNSKEANNISINLIYGAGERNNKIAQVIQQQWKESLGIEVQLQALENKVLYDRLKKRDYQAALGSWYADYKDPISFLEIFSDKAGGTNNTNWENDRYKELIILSSNEPNAVKRSSQLKEAEKIIVDEAPVIPLFFAAFNYSKNPKITGVHFSELGILDFKLADKN